MKILTKKQSLDVTNQVKLMLFASRDCLWNRWNYYQEYLQRFGACTWKVYNPNEVMFDSTDGYYGEAFGICRCLSVLGYGTINQANNIPAKPSNLKWWFNQLENEVLEEDGFFNKTTSSEKTKENLNKYRIKD